MYISIITLIFVLVSTMNKSANMIQELKKENVIITRENKELKKENEELKKENEELKKQKENLKEKMKDGCIMFESGIKKDVPGSKSFEYILEIPKQGMDNIKKNFNFNDCFSPKGIDNPKESPLKFYPKKEFLEMQIEKRKDFINHYNFLLQSSNLNRSQRDSLEGRKRRWEHELIDLKKEYRELQRRR